MRAPGGTLFGYPRGVFLLSFTELWERFSYFGMLALLVLFLTGEVAGHGFGWERSDALKLYGFYTGLVFSVPLLGGWIANNFLGERRCIASGAVLIVCGQFLLTGPSLLPWLVEALTAVDYHAVWVDAGIALGAVLPHADARAALDAAAIAAGREPAPALLLSRLCALSFFAGLLCIVAGTAFIKPTVSSIIGRFYDEGETGRDGAFAIFFVGIYLGALSASLVAGYLGERVGWHWGFSAAGFGMMFGLLLYRWKEHPWLGDIGVAPVGRRAGEHRLPLTPIERDRIRVILLQGIFTVVYAAAFFQKGGMLTLFANEQVNREVGGWQVPTTWFLVISTGTFILLTPLAARFWQTLAQRGRNPSASTKLAWGLIAIGIGYTILLFGMEPQDTGAKTWAGWLVLTYVCFGIGDVLVWPTQISLVTKLAPDRLSAVFVGGWYITIGIGSWLTGYIGALGYRWGLPPVFALLAAGTACMGVLLWFITPRLKILMHGAE